MRKHYQGVFDLHHSHCNLSKTLLKDDYLLKKRFSAIMIVVVVIVIVVVVVVVVVGQIPIVTDNTSSTKWPLFSELLIIPQSLPFQLSFSPRGR